MSEKHTSTIITDFTTGNVTKHMLRFSAPLFASNALQAVYNMVDMIIVGQCVGKAGLSAVSVGGDLLTLLTFLAMGFSNAGQVIIAQYLGAGWKDRIHKVIGNFFAFLFLAAAVMSVASIVLHDQLLTLMNTPAEAWSGANSYLIICSCGLIFIYGYNAVSAVLRGMGDSRHPFIFVASAAIINIVLDLLFVAGLGMGAAGAALATVIGQGFSCVVGLAYILKSKVSKDINLSKDSFRIRRTILGPIVRLGTPMAIKSAAVTVSKLFVDAWINSYGVVASSASGIESKINVICNLFSNAVTVSCSAMIGQNIGAEKYERVPKIMRSAFSIVITVAVILSLILFVFPKQVFGIFTSDEEVITASLSMVPVLIIIFFSSAGRSPNNGLMDGVGNYKINFVTAILDGIVSRIGLSLLFGLVFGMGWVGFLYGDAFAGFVPVIIGEIFLISGKWKTRKYLISE